MEKLNQLRESAQVQTTKSIENYVDTFLKEVSTKAKDGENGLYPTRVRSIRS